MDPPRQKRQKTLMSFFAPDNGDKAQQTQINARNGSPSGTAQARLTETTDSIDGSGKAKETDPHKIFTVSVEAENAEIIGENPPLSSISDVSSLDQMSSAAMQLTSKAKSTSPIESSDLESAVIDIGLVATGKVGQISDERRCQYLTNHFKPPPDYELYHQDIKKSNITKTLHFQRSWLSEFEWLVYSPSENGGFCKYCVLFIPPGKKRYAGVLTTQPFQNLSKAKGKDGVLTKHSQTEYHRQALIAAKSFLATYEHPSARIDSALDLARKEVSRRNMKILQSIVDTILLCGRQELPLRGHRDSITSADPSMNRGNFLAILEEKAKDDIILSEHLQYGKKNQLYTSKTIQNQLITIIATCLKKRLLSGLETSNVFSVIADEVTDPYANKEILSLCVRFVDLRGEKPEIREVFLDFLGLVRTTGDAIATGLLQLLDHEGLSVENIRGQAYDGAAAMSSDDCGVQSVIRKKNHLALYTHCSSHLLNLAICTASKLQQIRNLVGLINEVYLFFHNSPKRQRYFEFVIKEYAPDTIRRQKLIGLCRTRWIERHECLEMISYMLEYIIACLDEIAERRLSEWSWDKDTVTKANGLKSALRSFDTIVTLVVMCESLEPLKGIAAKLQRRDLDIFEAYSQIDGAMSLIGDLRKNIDIEWSQSWYVKILDLAEKVGSSESAPRTTSLQRNRSNTPASTPSDYYRRTVAIPFLDDLLSQLQTRFSTENRKATDLFRLLPKVIQNSDIKDTAAKLMFWEKDLPSPIGLDGELKRWKSLWSANNPEVPQSLKECLSHADECFFPNIRRLLLVGCTLPVGSCEAERSFSALKRIKTASRSTMTEERLTGMTLMAVHYKDALEMDVQEVIRVFARQNPRKMFCASILFGDED